jgi:uncharacterized protein
MRTAALGIMCKAPRPGATKTRLALVLGPERAAALAACFMRDVAAAIEAVPEQLGRRGYGVYAPPGAEAELAAILPGSFGLVLQSEADFGIVLLSAIRHLLGLGHDCAVLINSDSPSLPPVLLSDALMALRMPGERVVLGPTSDGGYYLIGLKSPHANLFRDIPWSTPDVLRLTLQRAEEIHLPVLLLPEWYDVDDAESLALLRHELSGRPLPFNGLQLRHGQAEATRRLLAEWGACPAVV